MKRILAIGRMDAMNSTLHYMQGEWAVVEVKPRPLTAQERAGLEAYWPALEGPEMTPEQCNEWFDKTFTPRRIA